MHSHKSVQIELSGLLCLLLYFYTVDIAQTLLCRDPRTGATSPGLGRRIALDIARGLHFLHARSVVHFDLKSANILLARDFTAKIADVGLAKIMQQQFLSTLYCVGTFAWAAPEVSLRTHVMALFLLSISVRFGRGKRFAILLVSATSADSFCWHC